MTHPEANQVFLTEPEGHCEAALEEYRRIGEVIRAGTPEERRLIEGSVAVTVIRLGHLIGKPFIDRFPRLRFIVSPTTGLNHIDQKACAERGIEVVSLKGEAVFLDSVTATSELALGLMLALFRRIPSAHRSVTMDLVWNRDVFCSRMLSRATLGIIGLGRLGRQMARMCRGLGMRVIACDPYLNHDAFTTAEADRVTLEELASQSDVISLHADYRRENDGMIDAKFLSHCRPGTMLINTARGELCDEDALAAALDSGTLGGLAADVLRDEGTETFLDKHPLVTRARQGMNVLMTPHLGGCCADAMRETERFVAGKLLSLWKSREGCTPRL